MTIMTATTASKPEIALPPPMPPRAETMAGILSAALAMPITAEIMAAITPSAEPICGKGSGTLPPVSPIPQLGLRSTQAILFFSWEAAKQQA